MAKTLTTTSEDGEEVTKNFNVGARKEIILDTIRRVRSIDSEIKTLQADRREIINKHIKGDLDMKVADFAAVMRLMGLEDEDQKKFLDTLRETFEAAGKGAQLNFLDAVEQVDGRKAASSTAEEEAGFTFAAGRDAGLDGKDMAKSNPHKKNSKSYKKWNEGWLKGQADVAASIEKTPSTASAATH